MEYDDDEFGDLYSDVLRPIAPSNDPQELISSIVSTSPNLIRNEEKSPGETIPSTAMTGNSAPSIQTETAQIEAHRDLEADEANLKEVEHDRVLDRDLTGKSSFGGVEEDGVDERAVGTSVTGKKEETEEADLLSSGAPLKFDVDDKIEDFDEDPVIPGLSAGPLPLGTFHGLDAGDAEVSRTEDWDSDDSGDDLQILLNDDGPDRRSSHGVDGVGGDDDMVFVPGEDQLHDQHQGMDVPEWSEEGMQPVVDGEKKEMTEAVKVNTGTVANMAGRGGYNIHGFHPHHHSQFKYVRPDVASGPGVPAVGAGQIRPFSLGNNAGRGRGVQRGFNPGYGTPIWGNSTPARGLEFTLPSHKTIFDVDIDSFDEKPWRCEGVDITDFFNFEMDEDKWKNYFKQLEQLRLESTMKSKIHVYESGRSEKDYDPDLPPELAAASLQDISAENSHVRKIDGGQIDLLGQGGGTNWVRPQLPTGRAIQVETGTVERFPTIDTRQTRPRDSDDAIIEIVLQGSLDDSEKPGNEDTGDGHTKGYEDCDHMRCIDSKSDVRSPQMQDGKCEFIAKKSPSAHEIVLEGDGILPCSPERLIPYSKMRQLSPHDESHDRSFVGRQISGISNSKCDTRDECTDDVLSSQSIQINQKEIPVLKQDSSSIEVNGTLEIPSSIPNESSVPNREIEPVGRLALSDSTEKRKEFLSDSHNSSDTPEDSISSYPLKKQKINSQVDPSTNLDGSDKDNSRTMHVDDIRSKLVRGNDYEKQGCEDEIMEGAGTKLPADLRRDHNSNKHSFQQKDNRVHDLVSRHEMDRSRITRKGKEVLHKQYQHYHRQIDSSSTYHAHDVDNHDKNQERVPNVESWHKRDLENQARRVKDGDFQMNSGEIGSRHRNKLRVSERKGGGEDLPMRKQSEEVYWRNRHDREGGLKQRDGGENLINRRENLDDLHGSRRKDEDPHRRAKAGKEILHGHRSWEDSQNKKERGDGLDNRRKDNLVRSRDKSGDQHFSGHRDDIRWHREREDKLRSKQTHENTRGHRERDEGESVAWDGNLLERKLHDDHRWVKDGAKGFNSDKESMLRRKRNEPPKRGGRNEIQPRHKGFQETHAHESQFSSEMKGYRNGRPINHSNLPFDRQDINREKHRSSTRRSNEPEVKQNSVLPSKRKHEDNGAHQGEKIKKNIQSDENMKIAHGKEFVVSKDNLHAVQTQEEKIASDEECQQESRRGRSKLERWMSNKERDFSSTSNHTTFSSSRAMEVNDNNIEMAKSGETMKVEITTDNKDPGVVQPSDKEESHRHLETVAKLKKRSERFKLPMPVEDPIISKKSENEVSINKSETLAVADMDIKQERPTRKRRWGNN